MLITTAPVDNVIDVWECKTDMPIYLCIVVFLSCDQDIQKEWPNTEMNQYEDFAPLFKKVIQKEKNMCAPYWLAFCVVIYQLLMSLCRDMDP